MPRAVVGDGGGDCVGLCPPFLTGVSIHSINECCGIRHTENKVTLAKFKWYCASVTWAGHAGKTQYRKADRKRENGNGKVRVEHDQVMLAKAKWNRTIRT